MTIYQWICLAAFSICFISCLLFFLKTMIAGFPKNLATPKGKAGEGIKYAFIKGMSPAKKETAYLHLPTYTAGLLFHLGTFAGFIFLFLLFIPVNIPLWLMYSGAVYFLISGLSGLSILIKRMVSKKMHALSNPDDYISNLLVTLFHFFMVATLLEIRLLPYLFLFSALLFLYIPVGKLRHTVFFFTSRIHLGIFYGRRGVWPLKKGSYEEYND